MMEGMLAIEEVEFLLVNLRVPGEEARVTERELYEVSPVRNFFQVVFVFNLSPSLSLLSPKINDKLKAAVIDCPADMTFVRKMMRIAQNHFNLSSTTVCDIPMKVRGLVLHLYLTNADS